LFALRFLFLLALLLFLRFAFAPLAFLGLSVGVARALQRRLVDDARLNG